jgi:thiosulfate/3-mercaptopyruvate sulfurtransferase
MSSPFIRPGVIWMFCCLVALSLPHSALGQWRPAQPQALIQPVELAKALQSGKSKPVILNVGPLMLYQQAHIPGAVYIGPGSDPEAIQQLRAHVKSWQHSTWIVLYCGCCPWEHCPNVGTAYTALQKMGFTNVKVLYIADNLGTDWVYKGYPTDRGNN